jgi:DNA-binding transcriptional LysR family regulator
MSPPQGEVFLERVKAILVDVEEAAAATRRASGSSS